MNKTIIIALASIITCLLAALSAGVQASGLEGDANVSISLGASILPAIAFEVTPLSINFGELAPGQTSGGSNLTVNNTGGSSINVTAEVTDNSTENLDLFVEGVLLNDSSWSLYGAVIPKSGEAKPVAKLRVPEEYAGVGSKEGTLMFWAENA